MAFINVKNDDFWDPTRIAGPDGKMIERETPANDTDFIDGWLIGYEENQGKDKNSTIYTLINPDDSGQKSVWGRMILNESLKKVPMGSFIRIQWLGKVKAKQAGGRSYHTWNVAYDPGKGLHRAVTGVAGNANTISTPASAPVNSAAPQASKSDLPF